jgi:hypothetical protein
MEPTDEVEVHLRRYAGGYGSNCCSASGYGYHNASVVMERGSRFSYPTVHGDVWPHTDAHWPQQCACGYVFKPEDPWQFNPEALYRRVDTGQLVTLDAAPAGAMFHCDWHVGRKFYHAGPDGVMLTVKLPDRSWWCVDGPSYPDGVAKEGSWQRSGAIPNITATPSILIGGNGHPTSYHGFLTNGVLNSTSDSPC